VVSRVLVAAPAGAGLAGLRAGLLEARPQWEVFTASGSGSALAICAALSLDAMVVDDGLGEEGYRLLDEVAHASAQIGLVLLSGQARPCPAHRVLPRDPPPFPLALAVQGASGAAESGAPDPLARLIGNVGDLPSSPATWTQLRTLLADPDVDIRALAAVISRDVGTTARVMRLVNSAFVGLRRHVSDVREAITILGLSTVTSAVLSAEVMGAFDKLRSLPGLDVDALSGHGLASGVVARTLLADRGEAEDGFIAGLLQDVGQLALATAAPDEFRQCLAEAVWHNRPLHEVEREQLGCDHAQVGAALLVLWQMPEAVVAAVAGSHRPLPDPCPAPLDVTAMVRLAHCLTTTRWASWRDPGERGSVEHLAEEGERVLVSAGLSGDVDEVGLVLAGELSATRSALRV
jgi:HD-like signal output (HDOD) protein